MNNFPQRVYPTGRLLLLPALVLIIFFNQACKKWIQPDASPVQIENEKVFADDQTAISAVMGLYSQLVFSNLQLMNGGLTVYTGLSADEIYNTSPNTNTDQFTSNTLLATNSSVSTNFWSPAYRHIYQVNAIIEGISSSTKMSVAIKDQLLGEVKCVRAFYYFSLVNLFGDVPLVVSTDYAVNGIMPRTASNEIYAQIIADIKDAKSKLNATYPSAGKVRPNKWTATALLARVYLFQKNWLQAEAEATEIINSGAYQLLTDVNSVFLAGSGEAIWQLMREANNTAEGISFIPTSATVKPAYAITNSLLNAFEANDKRKLNWVKSNTVSGQPYYYPYKYKSRATTPVTENVMVLRLAEQYLIRAEARAQLNEADSAKADLNRIRNRANLPPSTALTQTDILNAIVKERQTELFCEGGHRWYDLKRTGQANAVLSSIKTSWQPSAILYPIPFTEIDRNPFLVQNPGY